VTAFQALVLAGSRRGAPDPLAGATEAPHKALIRLDGLTLLARVAGAVRGAGAGRVAAVADHPAVRDEARRLGLEVLDEGEGPSLSVQAGAAALGTPLLVTTADHALLRAEWVQRFLADTPPGADVAALVAERARVEAAAPGAKRTYIRLADGHWSGCNLFWLATPRALRIVDLWRRVEADRKRPWRIAALLGPDALIRYASGRLTLADVGRRLGALAGVQAAVVASPYGLAAVDVDKPADLELVRRIAEADAGRPAAP